MAGVVTWQRDDLGKAVTALNAGASSFPNMTFDGWHTMGQHFIPPPIEGTVPTVFGRVSGGPFTTLDSSMGDHNRFDAPFRRGQYIVECFTSADDERVWSVVLRQALITMTNADLSIVTRNWRGPDLSDIPGKIGKGEGFPNFSSVVGSVPYTSSDK